MRMAFMIRTCASGRCVRSFAAERAKAIFRNRMMTKMPARGAPTNRRRVLLGGSSYMGYRS